MFDGLSGFLILIGGIGFLFWVFKIFLAVKAPNVYRAMEEIEDKRRERLNKQRELQKKTAAGALKGGISIARMFMK